MRYLYIPAFFLLALLPAENAHAYIDPGTGSLIFQSIVAGIATGLFVIKLYWQKIKSAVKKLFGKEEKTENEKAKK